MSEALLFSTDAREWANEFVKIFGGDVDLMTTWFASAIETGRGAGILQGSAMIREQVQAAVDEMDAKQSKFPSLSCRAGMLDALYTITNHTGVTPSEVQS